MTTEHQEQLKLKIPLVAPTLNKVFGRGHWSVRSKVNQEWHKVIWAICKQNKVKPLTKFPVEITTQTFLKTKRQRDTSNTFTANKLAEDGLVKAGILPDDTPEYVARHIIEVPVFGCEEDHTIITVKDLT